MIYAKLIGVLVQHWILLTATWSLPPQPDEGRSDHRRLGDVATMLWTKSTDSSRILSRMSEVLREPGHASKTAIRTPA